MRENSPHPEMARWYRRQHTTHTHTRSTYYTPTLSALSLRDDEEDIWGPAEVRRCRFIASDPPVALPPIRLVGDSREPDSPLGIALVVDDRGRVPEAASLGSDAPPFRDPLCGVPDARFLPQHSRQHTHIIRTAPAVRTVS